MTHTQPKSSWRIALHRAADVARPGGGGEAVGHVVGKPQRLRVVLEALQREHRAEHLGLHDLGTLVANEVLAGGLSGAHVALLAGAAIALTAGAVAAFERCDLGT